MKKPFSLVALLTLAACSKMTSPTSPSSVLDANTNATPPAGYAYQPFTSNMFRVNAPEAPNTIGFFWTEAEGALLHGKLASVDSKDTYAEAWVYADPWSPETFSFSLGMAYCDQTLTAQFDVIRFKADGVTPIGTWQAPTYSGQRTWVLRGPSCATPPPPRTPPACISFEIPIFDGVEEDVPVSQPASFSCPVIKTRTPISRNSCTGVVTYKFGERSGCEG